MKETVYVNGAFRWVDVVDPTPSELAGTASEHGLHATSVKDCLEPEHLPKHERVGRLTFVILRAYDDAAPPDADTVQELTRKVAVFFADDLLLTVHRHPQRFLDDAKRLVAQLGPKETAAAEVLAAIVGGAIGTYQRPLEAAENAIDRFEERLFEREDVTGVIREVYRLRCRVGVIRATMRHTRDVMRRLEPPSERLAPVYQDLRESADQLYFSADELLDDINTLLTLQLSLASHNTNEVMRLLTILSVFFMPLTFIVGVYGMNFEVFPELKWRLGYLLVWLFMIGVTGGIWVWFRRKGWL